MNTKRCLILLKKFFFFFFGWTVPKMIHLSSREFLLMWGRNELGAQPANSSKWGKVSESANHQPPSSCCREISHWIVKHSLGWEAVRQTLWRKNKKTSVSRKLERLCEELLCSLLSLSSVPQSAGMQMSPLIPLSVITKTGRMAQSDNSCAQLTAGGSANPGSWHGFK